MPGVPASFLALCLACWTYSAANAQGPTGVVQAAIYASGVQPAMVQTEQPGVAVGTAAGPNGAVQTASGMAPTMAQTNPTANAQGVVQAAIHASGVQPTMVQPGVAVGTEAGPNSAVQAASGVAPTVVQTNPTANAQAPIGDVQAPIYASGVQPAMVQTGEQPGVVAGTAAGPNGAVQAASSVEPTMVQTGEQSGVTVGTAAGSMDFSIASAMAVADIRRYIAQRTGNQVDTTVQVDPNDIELEQARREAEEQAAQEKARAESLFEVQAQVQDGVKHEVEDKVEVKNEENNPPKMNSEQLFSALDMDKDGMLSLHEFEQEARLIEDGDAVIGHLHAVFTSSDKNADGKIDKSEFPGMIDAFIEI